MSMVKMASSRLWRSVVILQLAGVVCLSGEPASVASSNAVGGFSYARVQEKAQALAAKAYQPDPSEALPDFLRKLSYHDYQSIRYRLAKSVWLDQSLPFTLQFFHPGFIYQDPVIINLIEEGQAHEFHFASDQFDYGTNTPPQALPPRLHFAGLRVLHPLHAPAKQDEVASFVGASYFRLVATGQRYGASARGLAINTGEPGGEEFPRFTELWIEKPDKTNDHLQIFALLNSPSVTGAYRFILKPGETTKAEIKAHLFFRQEVKKIGLAPLTSMFLQGESRTRFIPDFRPEVHDSDGLNLQNDKGEWLWRPLINPGKEFQINRFPGKLGKGFGLLQRDRDFRNFQDLEARYELRPSLWVEPVAGWQDGVIELVEIPTLNEYNDNIVTYWVPKVTLSAGSHLYCSYNLSASSSVTADSEHLRVLATRINPPHGGAPYRFLVDFSGAPPPVLPTNAAVSAQVQATQGEIRNLQVQKNEVAGGWRVIFDFVSAGNDPSELRLFLHTGGQVLSETWVYHYSNP